MNLRELSRNNPHFFPHKSDLPRTTTTTPEKNTFGLIPLTNLWEAVGWAGMPDKQPKTEHFALPWYKDEREYQAVQSMLPTGERDNAVTYDAFVIKIQAMENQQQRLGTITHRIPIQAVELKGWCDKNQLGVCRDSISKFGIGKLAIILRNRGNN